MVKEALELTGGRDSDGQAREITERFLSLSGESVRLSKSFQGIELLDMLGVKDAIGGLHKQTSGHN